MPLYGFLNYSLRFADQVSKKGVGKPHAKSVDFPSRTACYYPSREGLLCWTLSAVTGNYAYPEHTPG
jgi:hypothetical protein